MSQATRSVPIPDNLLTTLTGNSGGAVSSTGGNISLVGAGNVTVTGDPGSSTLTITVSGAISPSTTYVDSTPYTVLLTDENILVDTNGIGGPSSILLPDSPSTDGQVWTIKDWSGQAQFATITVSTVSSLSIIDGATSFVLANDYESASFVWSLSEGTYSIISEVLPSVISLPTSSATAGYVAINSNIVLQAINATDIFVGTNAGNFSTSTTVCTGIGYNALNAVTTGDYNVAVGAYSLQALQDGSVNTSVGYQSLASLVSGSSNCGMGENTLLTLVDGNYNLAMGQFAGANYTTTESSNILFNHGGVVAESNTLRIGAGTGTSNQQLSSAYISGIDGVNLNTANVVVEVSDQLGTAVLTPGAGITITPGTNTITIAATSASTSTTYVNTSTYTVLSTDYVILVDTVSIGSASTISLIDAPTTDGQEWTIKDATGSAMTNNITVQSLSGMVNIDLSTAVVMNTNLQSITVVWSASQSQYYII